METPTTYTANALVPLGANGGFGLSTFVFEVEASAGAVFTVAARGRVIGNPRPLATTSPRLFTEDRSTGQPIAGDVTAPGIYAAVADRCEGVLDLRITSGSVTLISQGAIG